MKIKLNRYGYFRVAACSPELRVADTKFNTKKIIESLKDADEKDCSIACFPEMSVTAYTCADLFFQRELIDSAVEGLFEIAAATEKLGCVAIVGAPLPSAGALFNCAIVINGGRILGIVPKSALSNSGEFYETRWFSRDGDRRFDTIRLRNEDFPFGADLLFSIGGSSFTFAIEICEDLWTVIPPSSHAALAGAQLIFNLSASNEALGKKRYRKSLVADQSARCLAGYVYSASGPGESTTDTVFSGHSIIAENGKILEESKRFNFNSQIITADLDVEALELERLRNKSFGALNPGKEFRKVEVEADLERETIPIRIIDPTPFLPKNKVEMNDVCDEILRIQTAALAKRMLKIGSNTAVIGVSGGLDSTLALLVAVKTFEQIDLDLKNIIAITMPGPGTSERTKSNAVRLAETLGVELLSIPIAEQVKISLKNLGRDERIKDVVYENVQARIRTEILMNTANMRGGIVIGTGDLSEIALGWSTYNGDHMSMYNVNAGTPKTLIKFMIERIADYLFIGKISEILRDVADTPISPELLPPDAAGKISQKTEDKIGPYILNDFFLYYGIRFGFAPRKLFFIARLAFEKRYPKNFLALKLKDFYQRFFNSQFKRSCSPDGVKIGAAALSPRADWRMPSDAEARVWIEEAERIISDLKEIRD